MRRRPNKYNTPPTMIVGISGKKATGKDTLYAPLSQMGFKRVSFASYLKHDVRTKLGLSLEQTDGGLKEKPTKYQKLTGEYWTPREIMIVWGQFFRGFDKLYWVKKAFEVIRGLPKGSKICITDVRFPNEADFIKERGGTLVRLERKMELREQVYPGCSKDKDLSETALDDYGSFDIILPPEDNVNPQDLEQFAKEVYDVSLKRLANA